MADLVQINANDYRHLSVYKTDQYGGVSFQLSFGPHTIELLNWLETYKTRWELEERAKAQFPTVKTAYEQYETALNLVKDQVK